MVESSGIEPLTFYVQGRRSPSWANPPFMIINWSLKTKQVINTNETTYLSWDFLCKKNKWMFTLYSRKEVIQPQVLLRLPCYDFTPVANSTVSGSLPKVSFPISGEINSHGVTGGEYKTRERIHRSIADLRLLVIPASWSRVAEINPNWETLYEIGSTSRYRNSLYAPL